MELASERSRGEGKGEGEGGGSSIVTWAAAPLFSSSAMALRGVHKAAHRASSTAERQWVDWR